MHICITGSNSQNIYRINKKDLLDRMVKSVGDFTSVFADLEMDSLPVDEYSDGPGKDMTAIVGFEGGCCGIAWASCSESFAGLMASRLQRVDLSLTEESKRAAMTDMLTLLGGDIRLLFSSSIRDIRLSEIKVFKTAEFDCSAITGHPKNLRCLFRHRDENLLVGVVLDKDFCMTNEGNTDGNAGQYLFKYLSD